MNKAFIAIASMIVAHFMVKSWKKAHDKFAKDNGLPVHDWDTEYEEQYGEVQAD